MDMAVAVDTGKEMVHGARRDEREIRKWETSSVQHLHDTEDIRDSSLSFSL